MRKPGAVMLSSWLPARYPKILETCAIAHPLLNLVEKTIKPPKLALADLSARSAPHPDKRKWRRPPLAATPEEIRVREQARALDKQAAPEPVLLLVDKMQIVTAVTSCSTQRTLRSRYQSSNRHAAMTPPWPRGAFRMALCSEASRRWRRYLSTSMPAARAASAHSSLPKMPQSPHACCSAPSSCHCGCASAHLHGECQPSPPPTPPTLPARERQWLGLLGADWD